MTDIRTVSIHLTMQIKPAPLRTSGNPEGLNMNKININELNCFITVYFGQDCDLIDGSSEIEPKIDAYIADTHFALQHGLIADIDLFLEESDNLEADFRERYDSDFAPELWGTTAGAFLSLVREKVSKALQDKGH